MKTVLVTGASGFVGRNALAFLAHRGFSVHAVDIRKSQTDFSGVEWHDADLLDSAATRDLMRAVKPSHLLHLAWYTEHGKYWSSPENYRWVEASLALADSFIENGGARAVFAGTCAEYDWSSGSCCEEKTPLRPATLYGQCKNVLRQKIEAAAARTGLSFAWGRLFFIYGPYEHPQRLVSSVIRSLLSGKEVACTEGSQKRDFLFVDEAASAFAALVDSNVRGGVNIASGDCVPVREMVCMIAEIIGSPDLVKFGLLQPRPGDPVLLSADVARLRDEVGWIPGCGLRQGLEKTVGWWKEHLNG